MVRGLLVPMICLAVTAAHAQEEPIVHHASDPSLFGNVNGRTDPEYPKEARERRQAGVVEITGRINALGVMEDVEFKPDRAESTVFVEPLRKVLPQWEFIPPIGTDCLPSVERVARRVRFELDGDATKIRVTRARVPLTNYPPPLQRISGEDPTYPPGMQRMGWKSLVYVRADVHEPRFQVTADLRKNRRVQPGSDFSG